MMSERKRKTSREDVNGHLLPLVVPLLHPGVRTDGLEVLLEELAGSVVLTLTKNEDKD